MTTFQDSMGSLIAQAGWLTARALTLLLLLLAAVAAPSLAGTPQNRAGEKSAANAAALFLPPPQLLERQGGKDSPRWYDAPGDSFAPGRAVPIEINFGRAGRVVPNEANFGRAGRVVPNEINFGRAGGLAPGSGGAPRTITNIGDLTVQEKAALDRIWRGGPRSALPLETRETLAAYYRRVAASPANPPGYAQSAFQEARARYLLGEGPNPGPNVHEFSRRIGIPIFRRGGGE